MPTSSTFVCLASFAVVTSVALTTPARAQDTQACVEAYETAQTLRHETKLRAAREMLAVCSRDLCPPAIRLDCVAWLREVDAALPTVIVSARDGAGTDVPDVEVYVDDQLLTSSLDGRPFDVDPGAHRLRVVRRSQGDAVVQTVLAIQGKRIASSR